MSTINKFGKNSSRLVRFGLAALVALMLLSLISLTGPTRQARASGTVSVCDFPSLMAALSGGGYVNFTCSGTIVFPSRVTISANTTLDAGGFAVTLSGNNTNGIFAVDSGVSLEIKNLTLASGKEPSGNGGAIFNKGGYVYLENASVAFNEASLGAGGAIYNAGGTVKAYKSYFYGNQSQRGGAIFNAKGYVAAYLSRFERNTQCQAGCAIYNEAGQVNVEETSFYGNQATNGGAVYANYGSFQVARSTFASNYATNGAAVYSTGDPSVMSLSLTTSILKDNTAYGQGGGLYLISSANQVSNSTLTNNQSRYGGGLYSYKAILKSLNNTLYFNTASATNGGSNIYNLNAPGWTYFANTILSKPGAAGNNCDGSTVTDGGNNLQWPAPTPACSTMTVADPMLLPLAFNGGPTETLALGSGSAALDTGNNAVCAAAPVNNQDQRGVARPIDGNKDGKAYCDIGAYELNP